LDSLKREVTQTTLHIYFTITSISMSIFQVNLGLPVPTQSSSSIHSGRNLTGSFAGQTPTAENFYTTHSDLIISLAFSNSKPNFNYLTFLGMYMRTE